MKELYTYFEVESKLVRLHEVKLPPAEMWSWFLVALCCIIMVPAFDIKIMNGLIGGI